MIWKTPSESSTGNGSCVVGGRPCRKVLNRHQRLDMPLSQRMNIFAAPVSSTTLRTYTPFSRNKLSISKGVPVNVKDDLYAHFQGSWGLLACQRYRGEVIDLCNVWIRSWRNIPKSQGSFLFVYHTIRSRRGEESMYWRSLIMDLGCLISVEACSTSSINGEVVAFWIS